MKTLIELYGGEQIFNVFAADALNPERVIFIGDVPDGQRRKLGEYFKAKGKAAPKFIRCDTSDCAAAENALRGIINRGGEYVIDITGGSSEAVFAVGKTAQELGAEVVKCDVENSCVRTICPENGFSAPAPEYKIPDIITLAGGSIRGSGHFDLAGAYKRLSGRIDTMWRISMDFRALWYRQVRYFQQTLRGGTSACAPRTVAECECSEEIMRRLYSEGILSGLDFGKKVKFSFAEPEVAKLICDVGVWLELYVYKTAVENDCFTDAIPSVVIDWNGIREEYDVLNEIDLIAQKGIKMLFISCKTGPVSVEAVNEISVLCERFGGISSRAVIITATKMSEESLCTYKRARELGIEIIELDDLMEDRLFSLLDRL